MLTLFKLGFAVLVVLIILSFIGVQPLEAYKDSIINKTKQVLDSVGNIVEQVDKITLNENVVVSDLVTVELDGVYTFDEDKSIVTIGGIVRPGCFAEVDKYYDIIILWGGQQIGGGRGKFKTLEINSPFSIVIDMQGEIARQYIDLLAETSEYKGLLRDRERLQEERARFQEREKELFYNLFWREAPTYAEIQQHEQWGQELVAREKQNVQSFLYFGVVVIPSSFVSSLELVVEAKN